MKWTTKKVLDQVTCSIGLFIRKYYFKSYIIVNEIIAEGVFSIHSPRLAYCDKNKENSQNVQSYQFKIFWVGRNVWGRSG